MPILAGWLVDITGDTAVPMIVGGLATAFAIVMLGLLRAIQRQPVQA